jgi:hypothetical protein
LQIGEGTCIGVVMLFPKLITSPVLVEKLEGELQALV